MKPFGGRGARAGECHLAGLSLEREPRPAAAIPHPGQQRNPGAVRFAVVMAQRFRPCPHGRGVQIWSACGWRLEVRVLSAHRTPLAMWSFAHGATPGALTGDHCRCRGRRPSAGDGGRRSHPLPVIGVPVHRRAPSRGSRPCFPIVAECRLAFRGHLWRSATGKQTARPVAASDPGHWRDPRPGRTAGMSLSGPNCMIR